MLSNYNLNLFTVALVCTAYSPCMYGADQAGKEKKEETKINPQFKKNPVHRLLCIVRNHPSVVNELHEAIEEYHDQDPTYINTPSPLGDTSLHIALSQHRGTHTIKFLVKLGADITKTNKSGLTPLEFACHGDLTANGDGLSGDGLSNVAFLAQLESNNTAIVEKNKQKPGPNAFHRLMQNESLRKCINRERLYTIIKTFISAGYDLNAQDQYGNTPVHHILLTCHRVSMTCDIRTTLLVHKANLDIPNFSGKTPDKFVEEFKDML